MDSLRALLDGATVGDVPLAPTVAGVDYIRFTLRPYEVEACGGVDMLWLRCLACQGLAEEGRRSKPVRVVSYEGKMVGSAALLIGPEGRVMVQISGAAAQAYLDAHGCEGGMSRLDVQVTGRTDRSPDEALARVYVNLLALRAAWPYRGRAPDVRIVYDRAVTVYSGRRSRNGVFIRCYNAEAVHGAKGAPYQNAVRVEAEVTGQRASAWAKELREEQWSIVKAGEQALGEANHRGARFACRGFDTARPPVVQRDMTGSKEATMEWLRRQVRPSVARLIAQGVSKGAILQAIMPDTDALPAGGAE